MNIRQNAQYLSPAQFAREVGVSASTIHRYEKQGRLTPHHYTPSGRALYTREQAETWNAERKAEQESVSGMYSDKDFAALIGLTVQTLRVYEAKGIIVPCVTTRDNRRFYSQEQVDTYFAGGYGRARGRVTWPDPE